MKILGIIPARYHSTRLNGKVLAEIGGKSMIQRVFEQASKAESLSHLVIATDSELVLKHCQAFAEVILTDKNHESGTERCAEVAEKYPDIDGIVNIQGDEPFISPKQIDELASILHNQEAEIATLAKRITEPEEVSNPNVVKVVFNNRNQALYFSRAAIPYARAAASNTNDARYFKHIGMYAYQRSTLLQIAKLPPADLELTEKLEQLRWLQHSFNITVIETEEESHSVDTAEDLEKARQIFKNNMLNKK